MAEPRILYVEDELYLGKIVKESLESRGFRVRMETHGKEALAAFEEYQPDLCVLDIMLPGMDGYALAEAIRGSQPEMPIIFLTAKTQTEDVVRGFKVGADDYVRKPFSMEELIVRIERSLNRRVQEEEIPSELEMGSFRLDTRHQVLRAEDGSESKLTHRESALLEMLWQNRGGILDRKQILLALWHDDNYHNSRSLDVYISKLRGYLKPDPRIEIITAKGLGYKFVLPDDHD